jgi:hypothetical protein
VEEIRLCYSFFFQKFTAKVIFEMLISVKEKPVTPQNHVCNTLSLVDVAIPLAKGNKY